jgi:hypothetical protein
VERKRLRKRNSFERAAVNIPCFDLLLCPLSSKKKGAEEEMGTYSSLIELRMR